MLSHILPFSYFEDFISYIIHYKINEVPKTSQYAEFLVADTSKPRVTGLTTLVEIESDSGIKFQKANKPESDSNGKKKAKTDFNIQESIEIESINPKGAMTTSNSQSKAKSDSSRKKSQQMQCDQPTDSINQRKGYFTSTIKYRVEAIARTPQQFLVITTNNLSEEQKEKLLQVLKKHKNNRLDSRRPSRDQPTICTHKILLEEDAHPMRK
ncbi:hypothetical protein CR513_40345, partial [Mucuna pruriens]